MALTRWLVVAACVAAPLEPADHACAELLAATTPTELCEAPAHGCVAAFASPRASCDAVCESAGLACTAAFDDRDDAYSMLRRCVRSSNGDG